MGTWRDSGGSWGDSPGSWTDMGQRWGDSGGGWADGSGGRWSDYGTPGTGTSSGSGSVPGSGDTQKIIQEIKQREEKRQALQNSTTQWNSQESYERAYRDYLRSGGTPISQPAGVILQSTMEQRRAEVAEVERRQREMEVSKTPILTSLMQGYTGSDPFAGVQGITKAEWKSQKQAQGIVIPRFGKMISQEEFSAKHPTPFMKAGTAFEKYETQIARRLNLQEKAIEPLEEWYSTGKKSLARMGLVSEPKVEKVTEEFVSGAAYGAANKPVTATGNIILSLLVTKGAGALVSRVPAVAAGLGAGKVARNINAINVLGAGLAAAYGFDVAGRVMSASSQARTAGEITATELIPFAAGGYLGMKPLPKVSIPGVKVKFYETNKPVSVPGMGVFYENSIKTKIILQGKQTIDRPPTLKEIPIKGEKGIGERKLPASRQTPETKNWISKFEDKLSTGDIVATKKQFYDLKKYQIDMGISVEKVTGKPYEFVRGIDLMKAIEKSKLPRIEKIESIMKETKGGTVGLWETRAEAAAKRPPVKLMSAEERTGIINNIKKFGGLYPKPEIKNIVTAATILGIKAITGQAQKSKIESASEVRQTQVVATKQYVKTVTELATISKQRTDLTPASFLSQVSKSVAAQKQISREATKPKIKEQIKAPNKYPERRILVPQLKPKAFLSKVSQHGRMRGKKKIAWDVKNPVPDLKSLGF